MDAISGDEIWRSIPPEEKFEIMARAQAAGVIASVIAIIVCSTIAIGLKLPWLMWGSLLASPFVYQFAAGKKWRGVKPRVMLEYLAARAAARRFAFAARGNDLTCKFLFRGVIEREFGNNAAQEALEAIIMNNNQAEVWIALFGDAVVMMEERLGGAESRFTQLIDDHLILQARSLDDKGEYSSKRELLFKTNYKNRAPEVYKVTSRYPAALVVFERKVQALLDGPRPTEALELNNSFEEDDDSRSSGVMIFD